MGIEIHRIAAARNVDVGNGYRIAPNAKFVASRPVQLQSLDVRAPASPDHAVVLDTAAPKSRLDQGVHTAPSVRSALVKLNETEWPQTPSDVQLVAGLTTATIGYQSLGPQTANALRTALSYGKHLVKGSSLFTPAGIATAVAVYAGSKLIEYYWPKDASQSMRHLDSHQKLGSVLGTEKPGGYQIQSLPGGTPAYGEDLPDRRVLAGKEEHLIDTNAAKPTTHEGGSKLQAPQLPRGYEIIEQGFLDTIHLSALPKNANTLIIGNGAFTPALTETAKRFLPDGTAYVTTRNAKNRSAPEGAQLIEIGDISNVTPELLEQLKPQVIIPLANYAGPNIDHAIKVNVAEMAHTIQTVNTYANRNPEKNFVLILPSSHSVWKDGEGLTERSLPNSQTPYGVSKIMAEQLARLPRAPNLAISVVRIPTTLGAIRSDSGILPHQYIKQGLQEGHVRINENPSAYRPYQNARDTAHQIYQIATHPDSAVTDNLYVLAPQSGGVHTTQEIADTIKKIFSEHNSQITIDFQTDPAKLLHGNRSFSVNPALFWALFPNAFSVPAISLHQSLTEAYLKLRAAKEAQ